MTDKVLTDDEKEALLDGVATGEVEVLSSRGPAYADVQKYEIAERSRLVSNSFPRLHKLNQSFASRVSKLTEQMVSAETEVSAVAIETRTYGEFSERMTGMSLIIEFSASPLEGNGLIILDAELIGHLVEAFYGGQGNEPARQSSEYFTRGETSVAELFSKDVMQTLEDVWRPVMSTEHQQVTSHQNTDIVEGLEASDRLICADFEIKFLSHEQNFQVVWPFSMVGPLLPVFEGQKRERDPAQDAMWERSLRSRLTESMVSVASRVGKGRMTLGAVAALAPGDIIDIDDPRLSTLFVKHVPILTGRFGVHEGKHAIEATDWLAAEAEQQA
ncbi:MAG: flagellar motor switch protein FliM [Woeseiaceae bacterium]